MKRFALYFIVVVVACGALAYFAANPPFDLPTAASPTETPPDPEFHPSEVLEHNAPRFQQKDLAIPYLDEENHLQWEVCAKEGFLRETPPPESQNAGVKASPRSILERLDQVEVVLPKLVFHPRPGSEAGDVRFASQRGLFDNPNRRASLSENVHVTCEDGTELWTSLLEIDMSEACVRSEAFVHLAHPGLNLKGSHLVLWLRHPQLDRHRAWTAAALQVLPSAPMLGLPQQDPLARLSSDSYRRFRIEHPSETRLRGSLEALFGPQQQQRKQRSVESELFITCQGPLNVDRIVLATANRAVRRIHYHQEVLLRRLAAGKFYTVRADEALLILDEFPESPTPGASAASAQPATLTRLRELHAFGNVHVDSPILQARGDRLLYRVFADDHEQATLLGPRPELLLLRSAGLIDPAAGSPQGQQATIITCDGPVILTLPAAAVSPDPSTTPPGGTVVFHRNVHVRDSDSDLFCGTLTALLSPKAGGESNSRVESFLAEDDCRLVTSTLAAAAERLLSNTDDQTIRLRDPQHAILFSPGFRVLAGELDYNWSATRALVTCRTDTRAEIRPPRRTSSPQTSEEKLPCWLVAAQTQVFSINSNREVESIVSRQDVRLTFDRGTAYGDRFEWHPETQRGILTGLPMARIVFPPPEQGEPSATDTPHQPAEPSIINAAIVLMEPGGRTILRGRKRIVTQAPKHEPERASRIPARTEATCRGDAVLLDGGRRICLRDDVVVITGTTRIQAARMVLRTSAEGNELLWARASERVLIVDWSQDAKASGQTAHWDYQKDLVTLNGLPYVTVSSAGWTTLGERILFRSDWSDITVLQPKGGFRPRMHHMDSDRR